jgi:hypothetical protein
MTEERLIQFETIFDRVPDDRPTDGEWLETCEEIRRCWAEIESLKSTIELAKAHLP